MTPPQAPWPLSGQGAVTDRTVALDSVATGWVVGMLGSIALAAGLTFYAEPSFQQMMWVTLGTPPTLGLVLAASPRTRRLGLGVLLGWGLCVGIVAVGAVTSLRGF